MEKTTLDPLASHLHAGGWLGSQVGGTARLFVSACVLGSAHAGSAAVLLGCGLAANLIGWLLWSQQGRLDPCRALQALVVAILLSGVVATRWLELRGELGLLEPRVTPHAMYVPLFVLVAVLLAVFEARRQAARRACAPQS